MVSGKIIAAIGNFDGVHLGHLHLIEQTRQIAERHDAKLGIVCFDPHPRRFFRPDDPPFLITSPQQRDRLLEDAGVDAVMALPFDEKLAALSPEAFVRDALAGTLGLGGIVAGSDFRFGKDRAGDIGQLKSLASENDMIAGEVTLLADGDAGKFGSSAIRTALAAGDMVEARAMLGRCWSVRGTVEKGEQRGRTIGFPTANFSLGPLMEPRFGVYATRVSVGGETIAAVSNFGRRPTVGAPAPLLETHLFDFDRDIYGTEIDVEFVGFIRDERKFSGLDELKGQIALDCERARILLADEPNI